MTDPIGQAMPRTPPTPTAPNPPPTEPAPSTRAGEPAPPGTFEGRARSFRENQVQRRSRRRELIGQVLVVAIILLGIYAIVSARPFVPSSGPGPPNPGPPISVNLTSPVIGQVTCGKGGTAYTEKVVWANSTAPVTTREVSPRVYELFDGDIVNDVGVTANVSSTSLCAGDPPSGGGLISWYVVLTAPNGTILLSYTFSQGWVSVTGGLSDIPIENGASMVVVTNPDIAGKGYGFAVVGEANGSSIHGSVPL